MTDQMLSALALLGTVGLIVVAASVSSLVLGSPFDWRFWRKK